MEKTSGEAEDRLRISIRFFSQRKFLCDMLREPSNRIDEAISFGFEEADTALMYFGLNKHSSLVSQARIAKTLGISECMVCLRINAFLLYLGYQGELNSKVSLRKYADRISRRAARERRKIISEREKRDEQLKRVWMLRNMNISSLPVGMPTERLEDFRRVLSARTEGKLDETNPKHQIIILRFGLDGQSIYRSLRKIQEITGRCLPTIMRWEDEMLSKIRSIV